MPGPLTPSDWLLAAPLLWLAGGVVAILVLDAFRPAARHEAGLAFLALLGAAWSLWPLAEAAGEPLEGIPGLPVRAFSGMLEASPGNAVVGLLCLGAAALAGILSLRSLCRLESGRHRTALWTLLLVAPAGMLVTLASSHFATLFLGIETLSLPLYVLSALRRTEEGSVEAGLKYFLLGAFASGFLVFGMALLYAGTGRMDPGAVTAALEGGALARAGLGFLYAGLLFKLAIAPFHLWVADVYQGAPTPITALMAAGTKAAAALALLHWAPPAGPLGSGAWALLACATLALANLTALNQENLKRILALSGVAHAGLLLFALAALQAAPGSGASVEAAVNFYLVAYGVSALAAFGALELLERRAGGHAEASALRGLGRRFPVAGGILALAVLSLAGIPGTAGFLGKYFVFAELVRSGEVGVALLGILLTLWSFAYYLRILVVLYMKDAAPAGGPPAVQDTPAAVALWVPAVLVVLLGVWPAPAHLL